MILESPGDQGGRALSRGFRMKRELDKWSLVLLGQWNTAILSPDWLAKEVFKQDQVRIMYPVLGGARPIFEAADMRVVVSRERVVFAPLKDDEQLLTRIEEAAGHLLKTLRYTPISAFGQNFRYTEEALPTQLAGVLDFADEEGLDKQGTVTEVALRRSLDINGSRLNLTITSGEAFGIELNYHYEVTKAEEAASLMEDTYVKNRDQGLALLKAVYDLTLDEEQPHDNE